MSVVLVNSFAFIDAFFSLKSRRIFLNLSVEVNLKDGISILNIPIAIVTFDIFLVEIIRGI